MQGTWAGKSSLGLWIQLSSWLFTGSFCRKEDTVSHSCQKHQLLKISFWDLGCTSPLLFIYIPPHLRTQNLGENGLDEQSQLYGYPSNYGVCFSFPASHFIYVSRGLRKSIWPLTTLLGTPSNKVNPVNRHFTQCPLIYIFDPCPFSFYLQVQSSPSPSSVAHYSFSVFLREGYLYVWDEGTVIP